MNFLLEETKKRNGWLLAMAGRSVRLPDGIEFLGHKHDEGGWRWTFGSEPLLALGDVVEVDGQFRQVSAVRPVRVARGLVQQEVEFCAMGEA